MQGAQKPYKTRTASIKWLILLATELNFKSLASTSSATQARLELSVFSALPGTLCAF